MSVNVTANAKQEYRESIVNAAKLLIEKADDIVSDVDTSKLLRISINFDLNFGESPELKITKAYYPDGGV